VEEVEEVEDTLVAEDLEEEGEERILHEALRCKRRPLPARTHEGEVEEGEIGTRGGEEVDEVEEDEGEGEDVEVEVDLDETWNEALRCNRFPLPDVTHEGEVGDVGRLGEEER